MYFDDCFEWDEAKNEINKKKHGVSFETASRAFDDPCAVEMFDGTYDNEERSKLIGNVGELLLVLVVFTSRDERTRLISARKANNFERSIYYGK